MIRIMKASAGSGKTWNLTREYLRLLLERKDPYSYRHILAVTFTNKATDEMKERILTELHLLAADPCRSDYHDDFVPSLYQDSESLAEASGMVLCNILHDYSAFAVSTIDRFFQQALKAFAKEIGQFSSYAVELDRDSLIRESVDRFLDMLTDTELHSKSLEWMTRKTLSQLEDGDGYKLDHTLKTVADRFNSEEYRIAVEQSGIEEKELYSDERLKMLEEGCDRISEDYVNRLMGAAREVEDAFADAGLDSYDTSNHFMSRCVRKYLELKPGSDVQDITSAFKERAYDLSKWYSQKNKALKDLVTDRIQDAVGDFVTMFGPEYKAYRTALQLKQHIYGFAVANDLYESFQAILKEKNVLTIDQTNTLLRKIIDGSDAPFIYEKLGVRYDHFLLDEFQDTSFVQWDNFRPLLDNSVAGGNCNLVVGDVKQSIYRWRQSEWDLLENQVQNDFSGSVSIETLETNYRSCGEIVNFNNGYFEATASYLASKFGKGGEVINRIYKDVGQKVHKKDHGMVEFRFCDSEMLYHQIAQAIRNAVAEGFTYGDIAILVRWNREGGDIAQYLIADGIPVVSDDSLKISSSLTVRRMVSLLAGIENPEDSMSRYLASSLGVEVPSNWYSLVDLCECLLRGIKMSDPELYDSEILYSQSFMDMVQDYVCSDGNSLRGFLKKWAEKSTNISSPKSGDSVRVMTVHKSKGLDFPYVIFPSLNEIEFFKWTNKGSRPDVEGTLLEDFADGVYDVNLSSKSENTLFEANYRDEMLMQYIDNVNVVYVALTRASKAMSVISAIPGGIKVTADGYEGDENGFGNFAQWTMAYLAGNRKELGMEYLEDEDGLTFRIGGLQAPEHEHIDEMISMQSGFPSWPLNPESLDPETDVRERGRLKFTSDAVDFFSGDGNTGIEASNRIRGIVLHEILSRVNVPEDLESSVRQSMLSGSLTAEQADQATGLLAKRIAEAEGMGWFKTGEERIMNEVSLINTDGRIYRPDRVIIDGSHVTIVDFKFGNHDARYVSQVRKYMAIWSGMGYDDVSGYLWYVTSGEVVEVNMK